VPEDRRRIGREHTLGRRHVVVPSATAIPAWTSCDPPPPPWWKLTQDAPFAAFKSAFSTGQSAIASEPSRIASVSRFGDATEPQSRWSRPMTIGAFTSPRATRSLKASPARSRSP
jgi:hypothetical protein